MTKHRRATELSRRTCCLVLHPQEERRFLRVCKLQIRYTQPVSIPFTYRLRVRYHECDGQKIVFNARYAEYIDIAALEYSRCIFGSVDPATGGIDWRLVQQSTQWRAPAHFDEVLEVRVRTKKIGTTSFCLLADVVRIGSEELLVTAETTYVVYDEATAMKAAIPADFRAHLLAGAPGVVVDCSAVATSP